jgi:hypothetical protein
LGVPADAELIKAFMRGILAAISAKSVKPLDVVARRNFAAPSEVGGCPPVFELRYHALPAVAKTATLRRWCKPNSVENIPEGERRGTSDHRVLLQDADITALIMPAEYAPPA